MPRRSTLNGIPNNLSRSFFSAERYYAGGYMGDWLLNCARRLNLTHASIDIMAGRLAPEELNIRPLSLNVIDLRLIIEKELLGNGFDPAFIVSAGMDLEFLNPMFYRATIYSYPFIIDKDGRKYGGKRIVESGYSLEFDPFDPERINSTKVKPTWWRRLISYLK